jgi:hypothetical protein
MPQTYPRLTIKRISIFRVTAITESWFEIIRKCIRSIIESDNVNKDVIYKLRHTFSQQNSNLIDHVQDTRL